MKSANLTVDQVRELSYVDLMSLLNETNRPPGGKQTVRLVAQNSFLSADKMVLEVGCSTGFSSVELASITGCRVVGIDLNQNALVRATDNASGAALSGRVAFVQASCEMLPFASESFHLIFCGGAIAWVRDRKKALQECRRVLKPWGFVAVAPMYYTIKPPPELVDRLSILLGVKIQAWDRGFWMSLFESAGFETYFVRDQELTTVSGAEIDDYLRDLVAPLKVRLPSDVLVAIVDKAKSYFTVFNENQSYLGFAIILLRKRPIAEQRSLFGA